ncbi:MAG TPA: hypothetical protein DHU26_07240 [Spirochaetaceae bacterium]|jgi:hypothetical protein|uniref:hypothetical protein n=1 Tax=Rectinema subterraneum TaxID=2653714 RepID=UPI000EE36F49|nr:hypothetical protein [Rectinema subterraneum]HCX96754.1 hypothetical protein [Spirochaetaceae bacterium]
MVLKCIFITQVRSRAEKAHARLLIDSIRAFGGPMRDCEIWVFATKPANEPCDDLEGLQVKVIPLSVQRKFMDYPFGDKVFTCATAEAMAASDTGSLIWLDPECLVVQPPLLFDLGGEFAAALRPVHVHNVGLLVSEPLDPFWKGIFRTVGIEDIEFAVESFVDRQAIRAYFNSHGLAVRPGNGLFRKWLKSFERLVSDREFQLEACCDNFRRLFLFQAVFSAVVVSDVEREKIRILPETYNYPYNLHEQIPAAWRAAALDDLVCLTYEGRTLAPCRVTDIEIHEPLRSWLETRKGQAFETAH